MRAGPRFALLSLLLLVAAVPVAVVGQPAAGTAVQDDAPTIPPDSMTMSVQLEPDGDARWTVSTRFVLANETDRQAFDDLAERFRHGDRDVTYDVTTFERSAAAASEATDREMTIEQVRYNASTNRTGNVTVGTLELRFRWTNFTETSGERLRVGDAFNTTTGTWFPGLAKGQTLVIEPPPGYAVLDSPPGVGVQQGTLSWEGPTTFEPGYFSQITHQRTGPPAGSPGEPTPTPSGNEFAALGLIGGLIAGLGALALGAYVISQRRQESPGGTPTESGHRLPAESSAGGDKGITAGDGSEAAVPDDGSLEADAEPNFDLLSDEERVEYLLQESGGRMKQATIVKETNWSDAKVSQLLSSMDEEGTIDKLRIGRENLISLPDQEIGEFDE